MYLSKIFKIMVFHFVIILNLISSIPAQEKANGLFWEISGNGLKKPSYLYGTIHIKDKRVFNVSDTVVIKLNEIPVVALEIDFDTAIQEMLDKLLKQMKNPGDSTTGKEEQESIFDEKEKNIIKKKLAQITGSPEESIQTDNPWLIFFTIYQYKNLQGEMPEVLDERIYRIAQNKDKKLIGLETIQDQLSIFFNLDQDLVKRMILDELEDNSTDETKELIDAYIAQDLDRINSILRSKTSEFPEFYYELIDKRNESMLKKIEGIIDTAQIFCAVGVGHLPGESGLISLLKKKGYQLRPVTSTYKESLADSFIEYKNDKTYKFSSPEGAFEVEFLSRPMTNTHNLSLPESTDSLKLYQWISTDNQNQYFSLVQYFDIGRGRFIANDSTLMAGAIANIISENAGTLEYVKERNFNGYPGTLAKIKIQNYILKLWQIVRGSRSYSIIVNSVNEDSLKDEKFFSTFRFLPYNSPDWHNYSSASGSFMIELPGPVKTSIKLSDNVIHTYGYSAADKYSGQNYDVFEQIFSDYYQVENDSVLFDDIITGMKTDSDSIISQNSFLYEGLQARDLVKSSSERHNLMKVRIILNGNKIFKFSTYAPDEWIDKNAVTHFFNTIAILEPKADLSVLFSDKSEKLLTDLSSSDTSISNAAKNYLNQYAFSEKHLDQIYSALKKEYWDDTSSQCSRIMLLNVLRNIHDSTSVDFISEIYPKLPDNQALLSSALEHLSHVNTSKSITKLKELLLKRTPSGETVGSMFYAFYYDKANIDILFPEILILLNKDDYKRAIYYLISQIIDSTSSIQAELFKYKDIIKRDINNYKSQRDSILNNPDDPKIASPIYTEYDQVLYSLLESVFIFADDKEVEKILTTFAEDTSSAYMSLTSVISLLKMNGKVMQEKIDSLSSNIFTRNDLYNELLKIKKGKLFPAQYKTYESLAEGDLYSYLVNDDYEPDQIKLLEKKELVSSGKKGIFYLYKFYYKDEDQWYVGLSGPQPIEGEPVAHGDGTITNYDLLKSDNLEKHWKELLPEEEGE